jgi:hypothetical protein
MQQGIELGFIRDLVNAIPRVVRYIAIITAYTLLQWGLEWVANQFGLFIPKWVEMMVAFSLAALYAVRRERTC